MIASWIEQGEITQVQSQKDISEVQQPLCRWKKRVLGPQGMCSFRSLAEPYHCVCARVRNLPGGSPVISVSSIPEEFSRSTVERGRCLCSHSGGYFSSPA